MNENGSFEFELINEKRVPVRTGQTVLAASLESGVPHQHTCGGRGLCSTCRVLVIEGGEHLTPCTPAEEKLASKMHIPGGVRLACQARVNGGPMRLCRIIRDETDLKLVLGKNKGGAPRTLGEECDLALFFLDIRNFTPFTESNLPYDVIHILNRFHTLVRNSIEESGGRVVEVMGDGVYAVFAGEGDISRAVGSAVQAGQRILVDLETFNDTYLEQFFGVRFAVGIGLHAGPVICGDVGVGDEGAFTALGHHVNVAARIESATKEVGNSFLITEAAYRHLDWPGGDPPSAEVGLKGVAGKTAVFMLGKPYTS
ncbi:MAG: adenylate/guanylate cyclase domain-containing protein [bacterium]